MNFTSIKSTKVKMVDIHPKESIFITACYNGSVQLWNLENLEFIKSFDASKDHTRCARFIPQLESFVSGSDDGYLRIFNYHTMERTKIFKAHESFVRSIAVHDQLPIILSCSDDGDVRQWDWSDNWSLKNTYYGHVESCMCVAFNPTHASSFATGSMDNSILVWTLGNKEPNYELIGHEDCILSIQYYPRGDKPYLLSGSDDCTVRLWDYQTKVCLHVFSFGDTPIESVLFSPDLPLFFALAHSGTIYNASMDTFTVSPSSYEYPSPEATNTGWSLATRAGTNQIIGGFDNHIWVLKFGDLKPVFSMDSSGKVMIAKENELQRLDIRQISSDISDGEVLQVAVKDWGSIEVRPKSLQHNGNGQYIAAITSHDFTIISSLTRRQKAYGSAKSFVWGPDNNSYATLEGYASLVVYQGFKKKKTITLPECGTALYAGTLLVVAGTSSTFFYDWDTLALIRQIDEECRFAQWSPSGELVALATASSIYILKYNQEEVHEALQANGAEGLPPNGLESAFDVAEEVEEAATELLWVGDCLLFTNKEHRLQYFIGGETISLAILRPEEYILGYLSKNDRVVCIDKERNITSYQLQHHVVTYMAAIVREDFEEAAEILEHIPTSSRYKLAQFLQSRNLLELALDITTEDEHRFSLAIELKQLDVAHQLASKLPSTQKWKQVADLALQVGKVELAISGFKQSGDFNSVLLILSSTRDMKGISSLADQALAAGKAHVALTCLHMAKRHEDAVRLLLMGAKYPEAAFYARTYCPSLIEETVKYWKEDPSIPARMREAIANPVDYPNLFPMVQQ